MPKNKSNQGSGKGQQKVDKDSELRKDNEKNQKNEKSQSNSHKR